MDDADKRLQRTRAVDDIGSMQSVLAEMTALLRACYGVLALKSED
jgi:hypothetical protein